MTKISARVVGHSKHRQTGKELATMVVTFPRFILAEFNTHRMFSRNSASSRAIPFEKMLKVIQENPFIPIAWQKDHKGMQGTTYFDTSEGDNVHKLVEGWLQARDSAVQIATGLSNSNVTKQLCNRLLEPFMWHTVIVTASDWENFFALRCPNYHVENIDDKQYFRSRKEAEAYCMEKGENIGMTDLDWLKLNKGQAEIHMMALAEAMYDALNESTPKLLEVGQWHLPFGDDIHEEILATDLGFKDDGTSWEEWKEKRKLEIATARCARVSYTTVGEEGVFSNDYTKDVELHDRLAKSGHWSPFEHSAQCHPTSYPAGGNFAGGWAQYRKMFANENVTE
jgi:thymidylate synthase ThyX